MRGPAAHGIRHVILLSMAMELLLSLVLAGCAVSGSGAAVAFQPTGTTSPSHALTPAGTNGHSTTPGSSAGTGSPSGSGSSTAHGSPTATVPTVTSGQSTATPTATPGGPHALVEVIGSIASGFQFSPATLTIKVGTTVRWINATSMPHTSTSDVGSTVRWDSLTINPSGMFSFTFASAGTYHYHCAFHPTMQGTIVVTA